MKSRLDVGEILSITGLKPEEAVSVSLHGPPALTPSQPAQPSEFLIVHRGVGRRIRFLRKRVLGSDSLLVVVEEQAFRRDCAGEEFGGVCAYRLLFPYIPLIGRGFLEELETLYKRHVSIESLKNLILEHRLASTRLIIRPEYFLYDKLRRLSIIYPPSRPMIRAVFFERRKDEAVERTLPGFLRALEDLVREGLLNRRGEGFSPTQKLIDSSSSIGPYTKMIDELEHAFRLYASAGQTSALDFLRSVELDFAALTLPRLPDPDEYLYVETSLGPQQLSERLGIKDFIERFYGVERGRVRIRRLGGVFNATYVAEFPPRQGIGKIFIKKYLNWTDFKWIVAWLWALGVKNFSVLASTRMSNEIYFINRLAELGFNTAEVLHVNWGRKMLFQRFIEGENGLQALKRSGNLEKAAGAMGAILSRLHSKGVALGDCNPFSFLFARDGRIYLTDLEQCSMDGLKSWDLAELILYTAHYLSADQAENFAYNLIRAYIQEGGGREDAEQSTDPKYARLLAPWTPIWIQRKAIQGIRMALKELG